MTEPRLTSEDESRWRVWCAQAETHAKLSIHRRLIERSLGIVCEMAARCPEAYVAWSAGKDSTALVHLVCVEAGIPARAMSIKDDLDFPGEEDYLRELAARFSIDLEIVRPSFSLQEWIKEHVLDPAGDMHSRNTELSQAAFYALVDAYRRERGMPGVYLGLRAEESRNRKRNRLWNGPIYRKQDGETVCQPLCDWRGIDVYAYLFARGIPLLPLYRCVRLHERPDRVRKSWWLPGADTARGGMIWLRTYYPSLFRKLCEILPGSARFT